VARTSDRRRAALVVAALALGLASGCGSESGPQPTPVRGEVTVKGQAAAGVLVVFHPAEASGGKKAAATSGPDGKFELTTARHGDGALPGAYAVTLTWPEPGRSIDGTDQGTDRLKGRYANPARPFLRLTVSPEPTTLDVFQVPGP